MSNRTFFYGSAIDVGFLPTDLSGLQLWLDATDTDTITKDGGDLVSAWNDKSGNGVNLTQVTATKQPLWKATGMGANSQPYIEWDGINDDFRLTPPAGLQSVDFTLFIVGKHRASGFTHFWWRSYDGGFVFKNENVFGNGGDITLQARTTNPSNSAQQTLHTLSAQDFIMSYSTDSIGVGTSVRIVNFNGVENYNQSTLNPMETSSAELVIGASATFYSPPQASEYLYYNRTLTPAEVTQVETYLNDKYSTF